MPFDALTLSAIREEIEEKLLGSRVQNVVLAAPLSIGFEFFRSGSGRNHLITSAHSQYARVHLLAEPASRDPSQHSPLLLLLRKYVRGGTLIDVSQPYLERVIELSIAKRFWPDKHHEYHSEGDFRQSETDGEDPQAPVVQTRLIIEVMGKLSNIILLREDGIILDAIKRVPSSINRYRTVLPHHAYAAPPPQTKRDPATLTINSLSVVLAANRDSPQRDEAWRQLVASIAGVSPTLAREAVFRAFGKTSIQSSVIVQDVHALTILLEKLLVLLSGSALEAEAPTLANIEENDELRPVEFAPYRLRHLESAGAAIDEFSTLSEAAAAYFAALEKVSSHAALRSQVAGEIGSSRERFERKRDSLQLELARAGGMESLREKGEFLFAYMHTLQPGQTRLEVPGETTSVELDPALTPVEQAQAMFREYRKFKSAIEDLPAKLRVVEFELDYLDGLATALDVANKYDDILAIQNELRATGTLDHGRQKSVEAGKRKQPERQRQTPKWAQPMRLSTGSGAQLLVGRTGSQNDTATFRLASPDDLWFHARGVPGAHVILRSKPDVSHADREEAAALAAAYSKSRSETYVDVICTTKRYVRRVPDAPPGSVTFRNETVMRVVPAKLISR